MLTAATASIASQPLDLDPDEIVVCLDALCDSVLDPVQVCIPQLIC